MCRGGWLIPEGILRRGDCKTHILRAFFSRARRKNAALLVHAHRLHLDLAPEINQLHPDRCPFPPREYNCVHPGKDDSVAVPQVREGVAYLLCPAWGKPPLVHYIEFFHPFRWQRVLL